MKNEFVQNVWPANSALFINVSTHCVETVKYLDYKRYSQLTRWCRGNTSSMNARAPGFNSRFLQGFLCCCFLCFYFLSKNTLFVTKFCNSVCTVYLFSIHVARRKNFLCWHTASLTNGWEQRFTIINVCEISSGWNIFICVTWDAIPRYSLLHNCSIEPF